MKFALSIHIPVDTTRTGEGGAGVVGAGASAAAWLCAHNTVLNTLPPRASRGFRHLVAHITADELAGRLRVADKVSSKIEYSLLKI